ncbi:MAG: hypothetical protein JNM47_16355 [Hyphomonadaceae bacterium]|nr:hypothetical protein [Hyphomonadaceae bacterium]
MTDLTFAVESIRAAQQVSGKPFAIVVAGHNGSGKSTMWYERLASEFQIPLINADRMMMSTLPEVAADKPLPFWATDLRDNDANWMQVAQSGVQAFVAQAMLRAAPFAMETVFSHWRDLGSGRFESKIDVIEDMQNAGYFVLLLFVGLSNAPLSIGRVATRIAKGGHAVNVDKLEQRFPRTQRAIREARAVADATILVDNSRAESEAFTVCRVQQMSQRLYDIRDAGTAPAEILEWLEIVAPLN